MGSVNAAYTYVYGVLSADSTLTTYVPGGIYRDLAPAGATPPYIIMSRQSGVDVVSGTADRIFSDDLYQIKVVGPQALYTAQIEPGYDRVDTLLQKTSNYQTGGKILACYREQPFHVTELVNGLAWDNLGGLYRIEIQA